MQGFLAEWRAHRAHSSAKCLLQNLGKYQHIPAQLTQTVWILMAGAEPERTAMALLLACTKTKHTTDFVLC